MTIHHAKKPRAFKSTGKGGGSKKGKPQGKWPWVIKVVADAILLRPRGTMDAYVIDRQRSMCLEEFRLQVAQTLPGVWEYVDEILPGRVTPMEENLDNRVYKMYYSGTSDRGKNHDPQTRACESGEHWHKHIPEGHALRGVHDSVLRSTRTVIENWKDYL